MANLYVVRHAKAGERRLWHGEDIDRPLSKLGDKQAALIGKRLAKLEPTTLLSSPYVRCIQTLEPLGRITGHEVIVDQRLREDAPYAPVLDLLRDAPGGTVVSTHGDIIPAVMQALTCRGMKMNTPPDWRKGAIWVLKRNRKGQIVHATVRPPPVV